MEIAGDEQRRLNNEKSLSAATVLFPDEEWVNVEPNIFVAKNRMVVKYREWHKWDREMSQVRILTSRGSVAYFLPEKKKRVKERYMLIKTHSVFIRLLSDLTIGSVKAKIAGELRALIKRG